MPCLHKFKEYLNLDYLDFEPTTLIVGTFNPEWPEGNKSEWFYGRTHDEHSNQNNNFWDVLPRVYNEPSLINAKALDWKAFCKRNLIAITDLISSIEDADENNPLHVKCLKTFSDSEIANTFKGQKPVHIHELLHNNPTIRNVYLTRGTGETFWRRLWKPVVKYCNKNGLNERKLLTPSGYAFYQHGAYNNENPEKSIPFLSDYILMRWKQQWHKL